MNSLTALPVLAALALAVAPTDAMGLNAPSLFDAPNKLTKFTPDLVGDLSLGGGDSIDLGGGASVSNPVLATILSIIPGLGQVLINNQVIKGLIIFVVAVVLGGAGGFVWFIPFAPYLFWAASFAWWIGNLIDAYTGNFYAFLPNSVQPITGSGGGGDVPKFRDETYGQPIAFARAGADSRL